MSVTITGREGGLTLTLSGEIDHHGARTMMGELDQTVSALLPRRLTLDLSGVTFMDSSGLALLMGAKRAMDRLGGSLRVVNIPVQPCRVLDAAGLGRLIQLDEGGLHR